MKGELAVMGREGDTKIIWDTDNEDEVESAERSFDDLIDKHFVAFAVGARGKKGEQIKEFDPDAGKWYRIHRGRSGNVALLERKDGREVERYCAHPVASLPDEDTMLAQKLMLQHDRARFLELANVNPARNVA